MIEKRTVFILGAGASCPYGFRTARDLRRDIIDHFRVSYGNEVARLQDKEWARRGFPQMNTVDAFVKEFDQSNTESIDLFLSRQPQFRAVGRFAILLSILRHEERSHFGEKVEKPERDWYFYLYNRLARELIYKESYAQFGQNRIAFVTFNYDRSLEHFVFGSLLHSFEGATAQKVRDQIDAITINHVYGRLSPLPWQEGDASKVLEYGDDNSTSFNKLPDMMQNLYVIHEERANPELEKVRVAISGAERIFFLGFGYAKENLEALGLPEVLKQRHHIYGTAMGSTPKEIHDITHTFVSWLQQTGNQSALVGDQVKICDCDCVHLLREFL
jgi:hypothetical protein